MNAKRRIGIAAWGLLGVVTGITIGLAIVRVLAALGYRGSWGG